MHGGLTAVRYTVGSMEGVYAVENKYHLNMLVGWPFVLYAAICTSFQPQYWLHLLDAQLQRSFFFGLGFLTLAFLLQHADSFIIIQKLVDASMKKTYMVYWGVSLFLTVVVGFVSYVYPFL